jgi:1-acyl-sn-glycerol-3-phosphate acyltransferase
MDLRVRAVLARTPAKEDLPSGPILLVPNHTSFWDGFIMKRVHDRLRPGAPFYTVMLERELERRPLLRRLGGMGIEPGDPRSFRTMLRDLADRLDARRDASVVFFPQGKIWPSFRRPLGFHPGIGTLLRRIPSMTVLPTGIHLEGHHRTGLTAYVSVGRPFPGPAHSEGWIRWLETAVEDEVDRILEHVGLHGEDAPELWSAPRPSSADRDGPARRPFESTLPAPLTPSGSGH